MRRLWTLGVGFSLLAGNLVGQTQQRVLEFGAEDSCVELPSEIFNSLTEATVEGWIKWSPLGSWSRFFDFGRDRQAMVVGNFQSTSGLNFEIWDADNAQHAIVVRNLLRTNQWCHIAAVTGKEGMKLYFNGMLVGSDSYSGSFAAIKNGEHNFLGRNYCKGCTCLRDRMKWLRFPETPPVGVSERR